MSELSYNYYNLREVKSTLKKTMQRGNLESIFWAGEMDCSEEGNHLFLNYIKFT